jgi:hypothetical protein
MIGTKVSTDLVARVQIERFVISMDDLKEYMRKKFSAGGWYDVEFRINIFSPDSLIIISRKRIVKV